MSTTTAQPAKHTFTAWGGATFRKRLTILQGGPSTPPRDLSGYTAIMNIRPAANEPTIFSLTTANGGITLDGLNGIVDLFISDTDTASFLDTWPNESAIYDLSIINTDGDLDIEPLLWGIFRLTGVA